jgi:hypothetical protein
MTSLNTGGGSGGDVDITEIGGAEARWTSTLVSDTTLNDSDKTLTVPADHEHHVLWIWVEFTSTATANDRQLVVELQDNTNDVVGQVRAGAVQAASLTRYYMFGPALADHLSFRDTDYLMTPLPPTVILPAGYQVRVYDNNAVDAAADDMIVIMQVAERGTA